MAYENSTTEMAKGTESMAESRGLGVKSQDQEDIKKKFQGKSNSRETQWETIKKGQFRD